MADEDGLSVALWLSWYILCLLATDSVWDGVV